MRAIRRGSSRRAGEAVAISWLLVLLVAGGCSGLLEPGPSGSQGPPLPTDRLHVQAHGALERWAAAVRESGGASITFVGDLTSQLGDWGSSVAANNKPALDSGLVQAEEPLSDDTPSRGEVKWLDGAKVGVKLLSAAASLGELVAAADGETCSACEPLLVTEARLATGLIETSRGPAEAPVWVFTIAGSAVRVTRVAVDESITITPPPWNADDPPQGISIDAAVGTQASLELEVVFTGAVEERGEPCGADYSAEAVESELAIVVIVTERRTAGDSGACDLVGRTRTANVALDAPLGNRAVLEVRQGLPVPIVAP